MKINKLSFNNFIYAGLWSRFCAGLWDTIYLAPISLASYIISQYLQNADSLMVTVLSIASSSIHALYDILLLSGGKQATLGMRKKKIKIIDMNGARISLKRSLFRYILYILPILPVIANMSWGIYAIFLSIFLQFFIYFHPQKQAYYDIICETYVVYDGN